jgi:Pentapeptide repeats (8 copies)
MSIGGVATLVLLLVVVWLLWRTGGANAVSDNAAVIGALIALGGVFTAQMVSIALDDRRTQEARDLEAQRTREAALQNYFEQVGKLLIEKPLRRSRPGDNLSAVVRAQTLSVLEGLAPERKRILLLFLYEWGLIYERKLVVSLVAANLSNAKLSMANLRGADLIEADLRGARGWTEEQRVTVKSLEGATMPNGQKYEDWLKSKGSREDG